MGIKTVPQPPYSPDLAPCDVCLFPKLRGYRYETIEEIKEAVTMPPSLTLSIIRYGSSVEWSNPGKGAAPHPTPWCRSFGSPSTTVSNFTYLSLHLSIYLSIYLSISTFSLSAYICHFISMSFKIISIHLSLFLCMYVCMYLSIDLST